MVKYSLLCKIEYVCVFVYGILNMGIFFYDNYKLIVCVLI